MFIDVDRPAGVREGESLDIDALETYLVSALPGMYGQLHVQQFLSGYSNLTYLLTLGDKELVLRRPPFGAAIKSAHDMGREFRVLSGLAPIYDKAPQPLLYCQDESVIGVPFYVMERVTGVILRPGRGTDPALTPARMRLLSNAVVNNLATIHEIDVHAAGLADLGRPDGYVQRQIAGWSKRYRNAQSDIIPALDSAQPWLEGNRPVEAGATLIHNDYKYDNVVLDRENLGRIVAVLDWEMCTVGDPLMDLGTTLGYWIEPGDPNAMVSMFGLTALPGNLTRSQVLARYQQASGRYVEKPLFYYVYGVFKIAVIVQQIYARFLHGVTQDARFEVLIDVVRACGQMIELAIDSDRLSSSAE